MRQVPNNIVPITKQARSAAEAFGAAHDRELLTILFTDLVDSTQLQSALGNVEAARLTELHRTIVRDELAKYDAREIEWAGDSCLAVFTKPSDGVVFALKLQAALRESRESEREMPAVRIGLHLGEIVVRKGDAKDDLFGLQVSEASRVMSLARGDQIYCTRAVFDNARGTLKGQPFDGLGEVQWLRHGFFELKGSDEPAEVFEVGEEGLAPLAPPEANEKCRPIKDVEKWRKRRARGDQPRHGVRTGTLVVIGIVLLLCGFVAGSAMNRLDSTAPTASGETITSLAVLPLDNLMNDPEQDYFVDGMTDALISELGKIQSLERVISFTSVKQFKDTTEPLPVIARALNVGGIIEGSVMREGSTMVMRLQLRDGQTERVLWSDTVESDVTHVLQLHATVAVAIAKRVGAELRPDEERKILANRDVNPEAYEAYLKGRDAYLTYSPEGYQRAIVYLEEAIALDDGIADAYAWLSYSYWVRTVWGMGNLEESFERARAAAARALELDEQWAPGHYAMGWIAMAYDHDWEEAESRFHTALRLNPRDPEAYNGLGVFLQHTGNLPAAIEVFDKGFNVDPVALQMNANRAGAYKDAARFDESLKIIDNLFTHYPNNALLTRYRFNTLVEAGYNNEAISTIDAAKSIWGEDAELLQYEIIALAAEGRPDEARDIYIRLESEYGDEPNGRLRVAAANVALGEVERAFEWLGRAVDNRDFNLVDLRNAPWFRSLHADPRYWEMCERIGLPALPQQHPLYEAEQNWRARRAADEALAEQPKPVGRFTIDLPPDRPMFFSASATSAGVELPRPAIAVSQDGSRVVYAARKGNTSQLYLRDFDTFDVVPLPDTDGAYYPFFSPDGDWVGFFTLEGLKKVSVRGGGSVHLYAAPNAWGATWAPDNTIIFNPLGSSGFWRINADGGQPDEAFTSLNIQKNDQAHNWPSIGPDDRNVYYSVWLGGSVANGRIEAVPLSGPDNEPRVILSGGNNPHLTSTGHLVYARADELLAATINPATLQIGTPVTLFTGLLADSHYETTQFALSRSGLLVYAAGEPPSSNYELVWIDRNGNESQISESPGPYRFPDLSPDDKSIVYINATNQNIWVYDTERGTQKPLTSRASEHLFPEYSPDGKEISFSSSRDGRFNVFRLPVDGASEAKPLYEAGYQRLSTAWTPDGKSIVYSETEPETQDGLWVASLDSGEPGKVFLDTPSRETTPAISTSGWIAYQSDKTGRPEVFIRRYPSGSGETQVSISGGSDPFWSSDGDELFYRNLDNDGLFGVNITPDGSPSVPRLLFNTPSIEIWDVDSSGDRFLGIRVPEIPPVTKLHVVQNFFEELKLLAPTLETN